MNGAPPRARPPCAPPSCPLLGSGPLPASRHRAQRRVYPSNSPTSPYSAPYLPIRVWTPSYLQEVENHSSQQGVEHLPASLAPRRCPRADTKASGTPAPRHRRGQVTLPSPRVPPHQEHTSTWSAITGEPTGTCLGSPALLLQQPQRTMCIQMRVFIQSLSHPHTPIPKQLHSDTFLQDTQPPRVLREEESPPGPAQAAVASPLPDATPHSI